MCALGLTCLVYFIAIISQLNLVYAMPAKQEDEIADQFLVKRISQLLNQNVVAPKKDLDDENDFQNSVSFRDENYDYPESGIVGPGSRGIAHLLNQEQKRTSLKPMEHAETHQHNAMTCKAQEWFVFVDDMPTCTKPAWEVGYNPTHCLKLKIGWIYCECDAHHIPGMKEGFSTCIDSDMAAIGRCHLKPCPEDFLCEEDEADHRYDCTQGNVRVPTWY